MTHTIRSAYGPKDPVRVTFTEPTLTKQSFRDECDINTIMSRYQTTGLITHYAKHAPQYGETSPHSFTEAMQLVANAQSMFEELPSRARQHFHHSPAEFLEFANGLDIEDENSMSLLTDLGLRDGPPELPVTTLPGNPPTSSTIDAEGGEKGAPGAPETPPQTQ